MNNSARIILSYSICVLQFTVAGPGGRHGVDVPWHAEEDYRAEHVTVPIPRLLMVVGTVLESLGTPDRAIRDHVQVTTVKLLLTGHALRAFPSVRLIEGVRLIKVCKSCAMFVN